MKFLQNLLALSILFALTMLFMLGCGKDNEDNPHSVTLAVVLPLDLEKGQLRKNALMLAIDDINQHGGIGEGHQIVLDVRSSEGADRAVAAAEKASAIISQHEHPVGIISCFSSSSIGIVEALSIPNHFPTISGAATSKSLSAVSDYFHRLCPPDGFEAKILADQAVSYGINTVTIAVEENEPYAMDLAETFKEEYGAESSSFISFSANETDIMSKVDQLLAGNPDAIFVSMLNPAIYDTLFESLHIWNDANQLDGVTFILCDGLHTDELFKLPISYMLGEINGHPKCFGAYPYVDPNSQSFLHFQEDLMATYEQEVASYNAQFYDIGYIYALAMERSLMETDFANMDDFRESLNTNLRKVTNANSTTTEVDPSMGWLSMKLACMEGEVDYVGASGHCDIDADGNTQTAFAVFTINDDDALVFEVLRILY